MRVVIIGGSHGGLSAARHLRKMNQNVEVVILEKSNVLGYIASSLNLVLEGYISELEESKTTTVSALLSEGINVILNSCVKQIDPLTKKICFETSTENSVVSDQITYDYLILAMGSSNFRNEFSTDVEEEITTYKTIFQSRNALEKIKKANKVAIIGAGLIGFELAESLSDQNKEVYLIDRMDTLLFRYFDEEISSILKRNMPKNLHVILNSQVLGTKKDQAGNFLGLTLSNGTFIPADVVVYAVNPRPNVELVEDFLRLNTDGTIETNDYLQTSDSAIYAVGDLVSIPFNHSDSGIYVPLVTNAYRTGIIAATNILFETKTPFPKMQRTVASKLFGFYVSSSGINETEAPYYGFEVDSVTQTFYAQARFESEEKTELTLKIVYDRQSHVVMGGQIITNDKGNLEIINTLSTAIQSNVTLEKLATMDYFYHPKFSYPLHFLNQLALDALAKNSQQNT